MEITQNSARFGAISGLLIVVLWSGLVFPSLSLGQEQSSPPEQPSPQASSEASPSSPAPKKPKKVWTNEEMQEVKGSPVSEVGLSGSGSAERNASRPLKAPSAQVIASYRKQLATLQAQQASIEKQIADFKDFQRGEQGHDAGMQLHKRYSTEPIDDQIRKLEAKHKQIAEQIDAVVDTARKKGIESRQLR